MERLDADIRSLDAALQQAPRVFDSISMNAPSNVRFTTNILSESMTNVDSCVPVLNRMYEKRLKAYKAVGYTVARPSGEQDAQADLRFAEIEHIAVRAAIVFEEARRCRVESVESDTRGFDLVSRRADVSREEIETRFIEVKGRAGVGEIALTANEYKAAQSLSDDYWLYVVFNCASAPQLTAIQNPARLAWEALSKIDCYRIGAEGLLQG